VDVATRPPTSPETLRARADALGDLARLFEKAAEDPDLMQLLEEDVGVLAERLKPEIAEAVEDGPLRNARDKRYAHLTREVAPWLLEWLEAGDS